MEYVISIRLFYPGNRRWDSDGQAGQFWKLEYQQVNTCQIPEKRKPPGKSFKQIIVIHNSFPVHSVNRPRQHSTRKEIAGPADAYHAAGTRDIPELFN